MRRLMFAVLLAGAAATPAFAQQQDDQGHHHHNQQQNNNAQPARPQQQRGEGRGQGGYYRQQAPQYAPQQQVQVQQGQRGGWGGWGGGQRYQGRAYVAPQVQGEVQVQQQGYRGYRGAYGGEAQQQVYRQRYGGYNGQVQQQVYQQRYGGTYGQRGAIQQQYRQGSRYAGSNWNRDWRNDRRYDWRSYRNEHRSIFRLGAYYDPFGYGYQTFDIGFRLAPVYFGQQYWIDPAMYELPYPPPGTQWIRYWNDAVLVDMYSGEVVDVIHGFFW